MRLPHQFGEVLWAVLSSEDKVGHGVILKGQNSKSLAFLPFDINIQHVPLPYNYERLETEHSKTRTIVPDGPSRMAKRPTGSGGEPSSPNCGVSAGVKARLLSPSPPLLSDAVS